MTWKQLSDEFTIDDIGARLLANLARGIYSHEAVLREYVQNACDSYSEMETPPDFPTINIRVVDQQTISIQDNGIGMDEKRIRACKKIAVSTKAADPGELTGFRGIGIWAGFQACDKLVIETTMAGKAVRYRLELDFAEILKHVDEDINIKTLLDDRFTLSSEIAPKDDHYTIVKLVGLHGDYQKLTDVDELRRIVSQHLPCKVNPKFAHAKQLADFTGKIEGYQEFPILVENGEVFKSFPEGVGQPQFETLKTNGEEYARCWYCSGDGSLKPQGTEYRSFRLRIRNFAVGPIGIYDDEDASAFGIVNKLILKSRTHLNWHVGEIHITHPAILPDTPRTGLELDQRSRRAIEAIRGFYEECIAESRALAQFNTCLREMDDADSVLDDPDNASEETIASLLTTLNERQNATRGRPPADRVKVKLRELLKATKVRTRRQALIAKLTKLSKKKPASTAPANATTKTSGSSKANCSKNSATVSTSGKGADGQSVDTPTRVNFEDVLSEIIGVIQKKVPPGDELIAELSEAVQNVFVQHGLIDADE